MTPIFPKSISDFQHISDSKIYIRHPISISDFRYIFQMSDISALALALVLALDEVRYCLYDIGYRYGTSDIDIGHWIYILDIIYIYWTSDTDIGNIGVILSQMAPHTYMLFALNKYHFIIIDYKIST